MTHHLSGMRMFRDKWESLDIAGVLKQACNKAVAKMLAESAPKDQGAVDMLTPDRIDALSLDELNRECARVMGIDVSRYDAQGRFQGRYEEHEPTRHKLPDCARDIAQAWALVEKIRQQDGLFVFSILGDKPGYAIAIQSRLGSADAEADSAPEAIARAFLRVTQADVTA